MRSTLLLAAMFPFAADVPHPDGSLRWPTEPDREPTRRGPLSVTCPRCGAEPGAECSRRTLSRRRRFHGARVAADEATR